MSKSVYVVERRTDYTSTDIVASYSSEDLAAKHAERENRKQWEQHLAGLRESLTRWETWLRENPYTEAQLALFDIQAVERGATQRGVRRAAREVLELFEPGARSQHDIRIAIEDLRRQLAADADFAAWAQREGEHYHYELLVSDSLED